MRSVVRSMKATAEGFLASTGYSIIPTWRLANRGFSKHLGRLFAEYEIDCVIDIGANEGGYASFLRQEVGFQGVIHSFEPVAHLADKCYDIARDDPSWHIHRMAVGEFDGTADINVMVNSVFSSFLEPSTDMTDTFKTANAVHHTEPVAVRALAGLIPELIQKYGFSRPYLKIDTQGFDLAVIRGAGPVLSSIVAMQTELSFRHLYRNMPSWGDVLALLHNNSFEVSNMFSVTIDTDMRALEFDCVLINNKFIRSAR